MALLVEKNQLVTPGELLAEGEFVAEENTYREDGKIYASKIGLVNTVGNRISVVPLKGCYLPKVNDIAVGRVIDVGISGWIVDIGAPYKALLPASEVLNQRLPHSKMDLTKLFDVGDLVVTKVIAFDRTRDPLLTVKGPGLRKVSSGRVIEISPAKIPRLIGRKGSMINMLKKEAECQIIIGKNGVIIVSSSSPENERIAISAIRLIEREAHTRGLTNRVCEMIRGMRGGGAVVSEKAS
jgi:exosome complex component RRP4